jgi:hypothetical protein
VAPHSSSRLVSVSVQRWFTSDRQQQGNIWQRYTLKPPSNVKSSLRISIVCVSVCVRLKKHPLKSKICKHYFILYPAKVWGNIQNQIWLFTLFFQIHSQVHTRSRLESSYTCKQEQHKSVSLSQAPEHPTKLLKNVSELLLQKPSKPLWNEYILLLRKEWPPYKSSPLVSVSVVPHQLFFHKRKVVLTPWAPIINSRLFE